MRWMWFVGSLLCFAVVFKTTSIGMAFLGLIGALACMLIGTLAVAAERMDSSRGDSTRLLGPEEIRHMREAEARRKNTTEPVKEEPSIVGLASVAAMIDADTRTAPANPSSSSATDPRPSSEAIP